MNNRLALLFAGALVFVLSAASATAEEAAPGGAALPPEGRGGYALGMQIGESLREQMKDKIDIGAVVRGLRDAFSGAPTLLTREEAEQERQALFQKLQGDAMARMEQQGEDNLQKGKVFLAENAKKEGVITTPSGLQYQILQEGSGAKPAATSVVKVHYHGTLLDGTVFDSSVQRKQPVSFPLDRVIAGWTEGVQLMPAGSKYRFFIPADLAYGKNGHPPVIPPQSTLIFEVELLSIEK